MESHTIFMSCILFLLICLFISLQIIAKVQKERDLSDDLAQYSKDRLSLKQAKIEVLLAEQYNLRNKLIDVALANLHSRSDVYYCPRLDKIVVFDELEKIGSLL